MLNIDCYNKRIGLKRLANAVFNVLGQTAEIKVELGFVSQEEIRQLNRETRGVDKVTDVLSFPTLDGILGKELKEEDYPLDVDEGKIFLGSIVLCEDKVRAQAEEYGHSEKREREYLIIHGLMHLFGYDHIEESDKKLMREKEKAVLAVLKIEQ